MANGTVKWFNPIKGYGFIQSDLGGKDDFVHVSALDRSGISALNEGQRLSYDLTTSNGRSAAENIKVVVA